MNQELEFLTSLITKYTRNLRTLRLQEADYGSNVPLEIINQILSLEEKIKQVNDRISILLPAKDNEIPLQFPAKDRTLLINHLESKIDSLGFSTFSEYTENMNVFRLVQEFNTLLKISLEDCTFIKRRNIIIPHSKSKYIYHEVISAIYLDNIDTSTLQIYYDQFGDLLASATYAFDEFNRRGTFSNFIRSPFAFLPTMFFGIICILNEGLYPPQEATKIIKKHKNIIYSPLIVNINQRSLYEPSHLTHPHFETSQLTTQLRKFFQNNL